MSYQNPQIPTIPVPIGVDAAIEGIRAQLATLPWVDKMFARAWDNLRHEEAQGTIERLANVYPAIYSGNNEYYDLLPNDNLGAYGFFRIEGPATIEDYDPGNLSDNLEQEASVIFWFNMDRIDSNLSKTVRFNEYIKHSAYKVLKDQFEVTDVTSILDDTEAIFEGYNFRDDERQFLRHPYGAVKFFITINYTSYCEDVIFSNNKVTVMVDGVETDPITGLAV